jgi:hypothetical protein
MKTQVRGSAWRFGVATCLGLAAASAALAQGPYPAMAPASAYLMSDQAAEIALARTAAPPSVSADAAVMVLGRRGYVTAAPGKNGFVCLVQRAWFSGLADDGFWNPKLSAPVCYNPEAARTVLPVFLTRTSWAMAGVSQAEIRRRTRAAMAAGKLPTPAIGGISYMMSKQGYLGDGPHGPWRPHLMWYMPASVKTSDWGADLAGSRVYSTEAGIDPWTMFYVPVATWSDGTPDEAGAGHHTM